MKNILIVAATLLEIKPLINSGFSKISRNIYRCETENNCTDILVSGIGGVATAATLSYHLEKYAYDIVINAGIAGSLHADIAIGDVVNVLTERQGDLGIENKDEFISTFHAKLEGENDFPYQNGLLKNNSCYQKYLKLTHQLKKVQGITVNTAHGNKNQIAKFKNYYPDAQVETMEGAAFFYACILADVPFIELRSISNIVEERNKDNWNIPLAIKNLNDVIQYWIRD